MKHIVVDGECLASIACQYGFADGKTILDHRTTLSSREFAPTGTSYILGTRSSSQT
jgi:hypothetical protein